MRLCCVMCVLVWSGAVWGQGQGVGGQPDDLAAYAGGPANEAFECVLPLSDGTVLIGGGADTLDWLPASATRTTLTSWDIDAPASGATAFVLHVSGDLTRVLGVLQWPADAASSVRVLKTTSVPGQPTGDLYVSLAIAEKAYVIARLDGNMVDKPVTGITWASRFRAEGAMLDFHPWDVGGDGKVVYATGTPHGYDWMAVGRLTPDGKEDVVPQWRTHWYTTAEGKTSEHYGEAATAPGTVTHSGIVLKTWGRGDFRSWTADDFLLKTSDGNGGTKQGKWPLDAMFAGPFTPGKAEGEKDPDLTGTGRGYFGYRWGNTPCANVSAIVVDRRTNQMIIGGNNKSRLPDGNPDFEPWVVAMSAEGELQWWQRLYPEEKGVSTPDQYVDALAVDYSTPAKPGALFVVARAHGNNVNNLWNGDAIKHPANPGSGFQNGFTGTHGNMHYSWLGKMTLDEGTMLAATYLAEYGEGAKHQDKPFADPKLAHWPHFRAGWPDLNSTRVRPHSLSVDAKGRPVLAAQGRRVITTAGAFQEMPSPLRDKGSKGQWSDFVRVYTPDLSGVVYSSLLNGVWDWSTGQGGSPVTLEGVTVAGDGTLLLVGVAPPDKKTGQVSGDPMPLRNVPDWAASQRAGGKTAVVARLHAE